MRKEIIIAAKLREAVFKGVGKGKERGDRMNKSSKRRLCMFCGQSGVTREHVWPSWLHTIFSDCGTTHVVHSERPSGNRIYHDSLLSTTVKIVCSKCNNGWMSRLEQDSMNILSGMIQGIKSQLDIRNQKLVSLWCIKTGIILDHISSPSVIPMKHGELIFLNRRPIDYCHIWVTSCTVTEPPFSHYLQPLAPKIEDKVFSAYLQTFRIGEFTAQILWSESQQAVDSVAVGKDSLIHTHIWPPCNDIVEWPKTRFNSLEEHEMFERRIVPPPYNSATTEWDKVTQTVTNNYFF